MYKSPATKNGLESRNIHCAAGIFREHVKLENNIRSKVTNLFLCTPTRTIIHFDNLMQLRWMIRLGFDCGLSHLK